MKNWIRNLIIIVLLLSLAIYFYWVLPAWGMPFNKKQQLPITPSWALENWLWEDDVNTAAYVDELLEGYQKHDIPIRTIILDSPWSLRYNDFIVDTNRYPNPKEWFKKLQDSNYRVVLWMTSLVNSYSNDARIKNSEKWYNDINKKGYLITDEHQNSWWKGKGGFIDYTNPEAVKWWRSQQQTLFDYGIDGWKLDGAATLFWTEKFGIPFFYKKAHSGLISTREYMNLYYESEYQHGLTQNPEFVTLSRSIDRKWLHPEGYAPLGASPINWVGDQKHSWEEAVLQKNDTNLQPDLIHQDVRGIGMAITHILQSADAGYNIVGSDIAGFSGSNIPPNLYIRWTQFSTFCGLFMNGGHGERRLWKRSKTELEIIRKFSWLHTELVPYMYHYVITAHQGGQRLQTTLKKGKYHYMFGDDLLVAPIFKDSQIRKVSLADGEWRYFFDDEELLEGNQNLERSFPLDEFPVFVKEGAIIPMKIERDYTGFGKTENKGSITFLIYPKNKNNFNYYHLDQAEAITNISYLRSKNTLTVLLKGKPIAYILNIHSNEKPISISVGGKPLTADKDWEYDTVKNKIRIKQNANQKFIINFR